MFEKIINNPIFKKNQKAIYTIIAVFFLICAWLAQNSNGSQNPDLASSSPEGLDTYIPNGFVLVPIEIQNIESLDSIIGQFAVVDLYSPPQKSPILKGVKLLRSPKNPSQFAVLVGDHISSALVQKSMSPFHVIVQNPNAKQSNSLKENSSSRIHWED